MEDDAAALEALRHVPEDHALFAQSLYMTGLIERKHRRLRFAEAAYRKAIACDPGLVSAHKELIYILGMQSRRREIDAEFRAMSRVTPLTHRDLFTWGLTHFILWGPDSSEQLQSFIEADPDDRFSRLGLAKLLIEQPGEEARIEKALEPLPADDPEAQALRIEASSSTTDRSRKRWGCSLRPRGAIRSSNGCEAVPPSCGATRPARSATSRPR